MKIVALVKRLDKEGFRKDIYSLDGSLPSLMEGYIMKFENERWLLMYYERGNYRLISEYANEADACEGMYRVMSADPTTRQIR